MQFPHSSEEGSVTQRGKETSTVARWAGGKPGRSLPGQHLAPIAVQSVGAVKMQPTASAAKVSLFSPTCVQCPYCAGPVIYGAMLQS